MKKIKEFIKSHKQLWVFSYGLVYFPWFWMLEKSITDYHITNFSIDDKIPFCEYFIIPYFLWFGYVAFALTFFLIKRPKEEFYKMTGFIFIGSTICLFICSIFPNGVELRTKIDFSKNIFSRLVGMLYNIDTNTNVFPSLHVYISLGVNCAFQKFLTKDYSKMCVISNMLTVLIILSTVFLKQHSILDVIGAIALAILMYRIFYSNKLKSKVRSIKYIKKAS